MSNNIFYHNRWGKGTYRRRFRYATTSRIEREVLLELLEDSGSPGPGSPAFIPDSGKTVKVTKTSVSVASLEPSDVRVSNNYVDINLETASIARVSNNYLEVPLDTESLAYVSNNYLEVLVDAGCFRSFSRIIDSMGGAGSPNDCVPISNYYKNGPYVSSDVVDPRTIPDQGSPDPCISFWDFIGAEEP